MGPQSDPEAIKMDMGKPFETYGIYCLGNKVGHKEWHRKLNFSLLAVLGVFFHWFCTAFLDFGAKRVSKMDSSFVGMAIGYFFGYRDTQMTPKAASTASRKQLPEHR